MTVDRCSECGRPTTGTWSPGGVRWALCPDCYARCVAELGPGELREAEEEVKRLERECREDLYRGDTDDT